MRNRPELTLWQSIWVWVRSQLPGGAAGGIIMCPDIMASQGSIPIMTGDSVCSTAAQQQHECCTSEQLDYAVREWVWSVLL